MKYTDERIHSYEKRLFEKNKKIWKEKSSSVSGCVLALHSLLGGLNFCTLESMVAKKIAEFSNSCVFSVQFNGYRKSVELLDLSYGIRPWYIDWDTDGLSKENKISEIKNQFLTEEDKRAVIGSMEYRKIKFGEVLHDELLRKQQISVEDDEIRSDIELERWIKTVIDTIDFAYDFFQKNNCHSIVLGEWGYICGLFARVGQEFGADIYVVDIYRANYLAKVSCDNKLFDKVKITDVIRCMGNCNVEIPEIESDSFVLKRADFEEKMDILQNGKSNVFILPHAFTDNPRTGDHMDVFYNYYEWFIETIKIIKDIKNVNWYIKDHPESAMYGQGKLIKKIEKFYSCDNVIWIDKKFSGEQITKYADCVVTCAGDAGIEYWTSGIPTITAANAYYVDWGVSYNAKTKEEYKKLLMNAGNLKKPSNESIRLAKEKLMRSSIYFIEGNSVLDIFYDTRIKQLQRYRLDIVRSDNSVYYYFANRLFQIDDNKEFEVLGSNVFNVCANNEKG